MEQTQASSEYVGEPPDPDTLSAEQIEKGIHDLQQAPPTHPVHDTHHRQHDAWSKHRDALYEAAVGFSEAEKTGREWQEGEAALSKIAETPTASGNLLDEAQKELDACREAGFDGVPDYVPEDVRPDQVATWKLQRLNAVASESQDEGTRSSARQELVTAMGEQLKAAGAKGETLELLRQFAAADVDEELRGGIFSELIAAVHRAGAATRGPARLDRDASTEDQIAALRATPGYASGKLKDMDRGRFDRITKALSALYAKQVAEEAGQ